MMLSVCPSSQINASIEKIWSLLTQPSSYSIWADAVTKRIEPEGKVHAGQVIFLESKAFGIQWAVTMKILDVDESNHRLALETYLPFGLMLKNLITCVPMSDQACIVRYG